MIYRSRRRMMETTGHDPGRDFGRAPPASEASGGAAGTGGTAGAATKAAGVAGDAQLGAHAPALLATEHWSLLAARSLIWSEA
jgi:hypothetical protein